MNKEKKDNKAKQIWKKYAGCLGLTKRVGMNQLVHYIEMSHFWENWFLKNGLMEIRSFQRFSWFLYVGTISATCIYNKWVTFYSSFFYHSVTASAGQIENQIQRHKCCAVNTFYSRLIKTYIFGRIYEIVNCHIISWSWTLSTTYVCTYVLV